MSVQISATLHINLALFGLRIVKLIEVPTLFRDIDGSIAPLAKQIPVFFDSIGSGETTAQTNDRNRVFDGRCLNGDGFFRRRNRIDQLHKMFRQFGNTWVIKSESRRDRKTAPNLLLDAGGQTRRP